RRPGREAGRRRHQRRHHQADRRSARARQGGRVPARPLSHRRQGDRPHQALQPDGHPDQPDQGPRRGARQSPAVLTSAARSGRMWPRATKGAGMGERAGGGTGVVAVAGEALVDFVPAGGDGVFRAAPGGSPANVAVGLARLEVPTRLLARIAGDLLGHRLRAHLDANRVALSFAVRAAEPTSLAIVAVGRNGVVEYDFRVEGTADWQWADHELAGAPDGDVVALHAGSIALTMPPGADVLQPLLPGARAAM